MPKRNHINETQIKELEQLRKKNKQKNVEKRVRALLMHANGEKRERIAETTGFSKAYVSELVSKYCREGICSILGNRYTGNRRNMSFQEEEAFLAQYKKMAEDGQLIDVREIEKAYEEKVGHTIGGSQIYYVLKRHGWRKVMPRSKHPNKADEEAIVASKKLTQRSRTKWQILQAEKSD